MKNAMKKAWWILLSLCAAWAPGLNMNVQPKLKPDAFEMGGYLHQLIGRTFDSVITDDITLCIMMGAVLWITNRYLYHKPAKTGAGEYLLCGFFSVMQLFNATVQQADTLAVLYANAFQIFKVCIYLPGMFTLLLCALRALNELLSRRSMAAAGQLRRLSCLDRHPMLIPFVVLWICWLPHLIIKYPGMINIDTALHYYQYADPASRSTPHPPIGTLLYGGLVKFAMDSGHPNTVYFIFTLVQTTVFISVLSYILYLLKRRNVAQWCYWFAFVLFAFSPLYPGWTIFIGKDSTYLIACMLIGALMLEHMGDRQIDGSPWKMALLAVSLILMMWVRHNGILIAVPLLGAMTALLFAQKADAKRKRRMLVFSCAVLLVALGVKEGVIELAGFERQSQNDWMSMLFQQTGRVMAKYDEELPEEEKAVLAQVFRYEDARANYTPSNADLMRWRMQPGADEPEVVKAYLRVWWEQLKRYPVDYVDAIVHLNGVLFNLQGNRPYYISLTDHALGNFIYQDSFNDLKFYDAEQIRPLNGWQRGLTEWYYRVSELPLVGPLFSMGFCMELMLAMIYLSWIRGYRRMILIWIPSFITAISGIFCAIVYLRYLLPTVGAVPLWFAAWDICAKHEKTREEIL